ncbi:hypothetical protein PoB_003026600 [Plakobranchus ocellatus]|uniref:Uncharacterized protein n=1 Tax=Plakobranchus ocellatus TaxID=259542 RepID=A0AAV3ZXT1_9GAST|nr:hypothetical protein PoB_003026600 [Plakobranchus ocellatus]
MQDIGARLMKQTYVDHRFAPQGCCTLHMILINDDRIHLQRKEPTLRAAAIRLWITLCGTASIRHHHNPPPGISKASVPVRHCQYPRLRISQASAPGHHRQYPINICIFMLALQI